MAQEYEVLSIVSCGKKYQIGETITDEALSDRDIQTLLKLGSIKVKDGVVDRLVPTPAPSPPTKAKNPDILQYVNTNIKSKDVAALEKIKGVGNQTAKAMINHGEFKSLAQLSDLVSNVNWDSIKVADIK